MANYLIIGNGVAGVRATETIRAQDKASSITIFSDEAYPFYLRPQLPQYVAGKIEEKRLEGKPSSFYQQKRINLQLDRKVIKIVPAKREVVSAQGEKFSYDKLLIASGGGFKLPSIYQVDLEGIVTLKTLDDARRIKGLIPQTKEALVIGEGILTLELAKSFREAGIKVTYLIEEDRLWPEFLDPAASRLLELILKQKGIEFKKGSKIKEIIAKKGEIEGILNSKKEFISCQLIGVGEEFVPNLDFLEGSGIETKRGILVNQYLQTNIPEIFAAGDGAQISELNQEIPEINVGWLRAWQQGEIAGLNMLGKEAFYDPFASFASTQILGIDFAALGISNPKSAEYQIITGDFPHPETDVYKKLVVKEGKIVGALLIKSVEEASELAKLIREKTPLAQIDKNLLKQMFDLGYIVSSFKGVLCPVCKLWMTLPQGSKEGDRITCPACGVEFTLFKEKEKWVAKTSLKK